mgnify:CR=1 FL=1
MVCCFLLPFQESTSLNELHMELPRGDGPSSLALVDRLTHTQSIWSLSLTCIGARPEDIAVAALLSGLKKNTTLRELTLEVNVLQRAATVFPILSSLCDHPYLKKLCLRGLNLYELETVLLRDTSKITELDIHENSVGQPLMGLEPFLRAKAHRPSLTKLGLHCPLGRDEGRLPVMALCNTTRLQTLVLQDNTR